VADERRYPAAWLQRSMYDAAHEHMSAANVPIAVRLRGALDKGRLRAAVNDLAARHEALRTRLVMSDAGLVQAVSDEAPAIEVPEQHVTADGLMEACRSEFSRPIDLRGPLVRARLFTTGDRDYLLTIAADHTIMDGFSAGIIARELAALYAGDRIPPPALQYGDYAVWDNRAITAAQREYWMTLLSSAGARLDFGASPASPADGLTTQAYQLPEIGHDRLAALARSWRVPVVALLGALAVMPLRGYASRSIVLGLYTGNRDWRELAATVGLIAALMPVLVTTHDGQGLEELAHNIADAIHDGQDHRVPLRAVRDLLNPRDGMPLFDVSLNYLPPLRQMNALSADGLTMSASFLEFPSPTRFAHKWHDGMAFIDYRWRVTSGQLDGYLDMTGPASFDAGTREEIRESIMRGTSGYS
jgi:hypothetical protein